MNGRPFFPEEVEFLEEHWARCGTNWCGRALHREPGAISRKVASLGLRQIGSPPAPRLSSIQHSTLYSTAQLDAPDFIGGAYTDGHIDFGTATVLRDLVRAKRIDEALDSLMSAKRRAA